MNSTTRREQSRLAFYRHYGSGMLLAVVLTSTLVCSCGRSTQQRASYQMGTNGTVVVDLDEQSRVRRLLQSYPDGRLKLTMLLDYSGRDLKHVRIVDADGGVAHETAISATADTVSARGSATPSPGWDIEYAFSSGGQTGEFQRRRSWYCGSNLLYQVQQTWSKDETEVKCEVSGPCGIILFTNTYSVK